MESLSIYIYIYFCTFAARGVGGKSRCRFELDNRFGNGRTGSSAEPDNSDKKHLNTNGRY